MNEEDIKSYNTSIKISTVLVIISFFIATLIFSAISMIFSVRAYNLGKYDYKKRKKALLLESLAFFTAGSMSAMRNSQYALEGLLGCLLGCLLLYLIMVKITNNKYGKTELVEEDDEEEYTYVCPSCKREVKYGTRFCKYCSTEIDWGNDDEDEEEYDEDLDEEYDEDLEDSNFYEEEEDIDENDEFFKEQFVFSYDKVKEVLKKMGYTSFATFRKEVYENKHIKRKKFEDKEKECNYLVKALGYDDFEDFYNENM